MANKPKRLRVGGQFAYEASGLIWRTPLDEPAIHEASNSNDPSTLFTCFSDSLNKRQLRSFRDTGRST